MPEVVARSSAISSVTGTCAFECFLFSHNYIPLSQIHDQIMNSYSGGVSFFDRLKHLSNFMWPQLLHPVVPEDSLNIKIRKKLINNLIGNLL